MRYQQYKNKMLRIRKIIDVFYHLRFVIAGVVVAVVAGSVTLDLSKGNITETSDFEISYVYGQEIQYSGKAFMGEVTYEFRKKGAGEEDWTEETPKYAGQYEARARSMGNHGYKYSKVTSFEIKPYETTFAIKDDKINFGNEKPELTYTLLPGDHLANEYHVTYETLLEKTTNASIDVDTLRIYNQENIEVTDCYAITAETKEITFNPIKITVNFATPDPFIFTGEEEGYRYDERTITVDCPNNQPLYGAHVEVTGGISRVMVGSEKNEHTVKVVDDEGNDYTANYDITINENTITVNKAAPVKVTSKSLSKPYDNKPFTLEEFGDLTVEGLLENVHGIRNVQFLHKDVVTCEEANNIDNTFTYEIYDKATGETIDPSKYYQSVTNIPGKINITKIPITVNAADVIAYFNNKDVNGYKEGQEISYTGDLVGDDFLKVETFSKAKDPGSYDNNYTCKVYRQEMIDEVLTDVDVSSNYDLSYNPGNIEINVKPLVIAFDGRTVTYNGADQLMYESDGYIKSGTIDDGWSVVAKLYKDPDATSKEQLTMKDFLGTDEVYSANETNVYLEIHDELGNDVTKKYRVDETPGNDGAIYDVTFEFGTSKVEKADLEINVTDFEPITFNNKTFKDNLDLGSRVTATGLMPGDSLTVSYEDKTQENITDASDVPYNVGLDIEIVNSSKVSVAHNYEITYNREPTTSSITVNKKNIEIHTPNIEKFYDATNSLPLSTLKFADGPDGEKITYANKQYAAPSANAGLYTYTSFDVNDITISLSNKDVTSNYIIDFIEDGEINIKKRPIEISQVTSTVSHIFYDKQNHGVFDGSNEVVFTQEQTDKGLLTSKGHSLTFTDPKFKSTTDGPSYYGAGLSNAEKDAYYGTSILDSEMNSVKDNYEVTYKEDYMTINIIKKRVQIVSGSKTKVFDGDKIDLCGVNYENDTWYDISNFGSTQYTSNVTYYNESTAQYVNTTLNTGHKIQVTKTLASELDVSMNYGNHTNQFYYRVVDANNNDVSDYYDFLISYGDLYVHHLDINVFLDNRTQDYNGSSITYPNGSNISQTEVGLNVTEKTRNSGAYLTFSYPNGVDFDDVTFYKNYSIKSTFVKPDYDNYFFARTYSFAVSFDIYTTGETPAVYDNISNISLNTHAMTFTFTVYKISLKISSPTAQIRIIVSGALASGDDLYFGSDKYTHSSARRPRAWTSEYTEENVHIYRGGLGGTDVTGCYSISLT